MTPDEAQQEHQPVTRNGGSRPVPDPTFLTDAAISKAVSALRDYIDGQIAVRDERLRGIDEATKLRLDQVTALHAALESHITGAVAARAAVVDEKFRSVESRFQERDTRSENEKLDSQKAVDAAFAAQKEAAAAQETSNRAAIDKSEKGTAEAIGKLEQLFKTTTDALRDKIDDVKTTANATVQQKVGGTENRTAIFAVIGIVVTIALAVLTVVSFALANTP